MSSKPGLNIFSGESGLGAALTNPTELARRKGRVAQSYPVVFAGKRYPDVETAYHLLADKADTVCTDRLMAELIAAKFRQHSELAQSVASRGGAAWLAQCTHWTGAQSQSARNWEGAGLSSRFIRNLVKGYEMSLTDIVVEHAQQALF